MKAIIKLSILVLLGIFISRQSSAQESYLRVNTGYSLGALEKIIFPGEPQGWNSKASLGEGFNVGAAYGYMFNDNIGIELGISYFSGRSQTLHIPRPSESSRREGLSAQMVQIVPSVVLRGGFDKLDPYIRLGMLMGVGTVTYDRSINQSEYVYHGSWKYNGSLALGVSAGLGLSYQIKDRMSIFAETAFIGMSYAPTRGELNKRTINGVDNLDGLTTNEREIRFVDSYTPHNIMEPGNEDPNSPQEADRRSYAMSSIGLNVGVIFNF